LLNVILLAIVIDWILGDPYTWPHPVRFFGWWIRKLEAFIRKTFKNLYSGGAVLLVLALIMPLALLALLNRILPTSLIVVLNVYLLYTSLAAKCLKDEAIKVKKLIDADALEASKKELGYLVGRDTNNLTKTQVLRGIIETVSENTVDGILAPLFYMLLGSPFGLSVYFVVAYKIINTLDSTIGYMQAPYKEIGYCSAKLDDIVNYIPARLGAIMMLLAGAVLRLDVKNGLKMMWRDHGNHKSPNCGYPEATTAGLLNIQLGGTNTYFGEVVVKPTIGDFNQPLSTDDIVKSVKLIYGSEIFLFVFGLLILGFY